ncbi:MAG: Arc family DNA-binding protein [Chloroflexi bacterium]|nr:Arc family DNA-binding protein [Chloroflexota bacterium]
MDHATEMEFTLRLPADLYTQLVQLAESEHRSLQSMLVTMLRETLDKQQNQTRQDIMDQWDDHDRLSS